MSHDLNLHGEKGCQPIGFPARYPSNGRYIYSEGEDLVEKRNTSVVSKYCLSVGQIGGLSAFPVVSGENGKPTRP